MRVHHSGRTALVRIAYTAAIATLLASCGLVSQLDPAFEGAKEDADALGNAIAEHVERAGALPRIASTVIEDADGWPVWGPEWRVELTTFPRSEPSEGRLFNLVGTADAWCVETAYFPASRPDDAAPTAWVSVSGTGADHQDPKAGRCDSSLSIMLTPAPTGVYAPGTVIDVLEASAGTCVVDPFEGNAAAGVVDETGRVEVLECNEPHRFEIYALGADLVTDLEDPRSDPCGVAFTSYVGVPPSLSSFTQESIRPGPGESDFACILYHYGEDYPLVGTARESWR
ncbi:MAG: hypothetical protein CVT64_04125 [Actinobacteria bacterium HGW-Actinobacteria-4]|nr:MAG: hypothetical protein CVT64_04125 [Actinobacteria bacterium HGW-Actinobacteria-4]